MTVTISIDNYLLIDACDNSSNWTGESPVNQTGFYKQNSACVGFVCRGDGTNDMYVTGSWNLSSASHVHMWYLSAIIAEFVSLQFYFSDGTNTAYYNAMAAADYPGGWFNIVCDYTRTPDSGTAPTWSSITTVGVRITHTGTAKNAENTWFDHLYVGDGITAYGDDGGSEFDLEDIYTLDAADTVSAGGYGIITKFGGSYFMVGNLTLGDSASTNSCDFQALNQILVFEQRYYNVSTTQLLDAILYEIKCVGNGTGTTSIMFGAASGGRGISGCVVVAQDSGRPVKFTATDTNVGTLGLYGSTWNNHAVMDFMVNSGTREIISNNFVNSAYQIQPNTMTFTYNFVIGNTSTDGAVLYESTSHNISYTNYINNTAATEFTAAGSYNMTGDLFTGGTYDIHFSASTGDLTITCVGDPRANPSDGQVDNDSTGTVTIVNSVTVTAIVKNVSGTVISSALVLMYADTGGPFPSGASVTSITRSGSTATVTQTSHGLLTDEWVMILGANEEEYNGVYQITVTDADTYTYTISGTPDTPATGTITCTYVIIFELSNGSGIADNSMRYRGSNQPFTGWARKSSGSPYYRQAPMSGEIGSSDFTTTVILTSDE